MSWAAAALSSAMPRRLSISMMGLGVDFSDTPSAPHRGADGSAADLSLAPSAGADGAPWPRILRRAPRGLGGDSEAVGRGSPKSTRSPRNVFKNTIKAGRYQFYSLAPRFVGGYAIREAVVNNPKPLASPSLARPEGRQAKRAMSDRAKLGSRMGEGGNSRVSCLYPS